MNQAKLMLMGKFQPIILGISRLMLTFGRLLLKASKKYEGLKGESGEYTKFKILHSSLNLSFEII